MTTPRLRSNLSSGEREGTGCPLRELTLPPLVRGPKGQLMEKPGTTSAHRPHGHPHPHPQGSWGDKGGGGGGEGPGAQHHTQYIRRLVDLRDELISQEETGLARALDRLRLQSINNRDAARYRLKIKEQAAASGESPRVGLAPQQGTSYPRPMLTTVEKFRQMRPQRRPPVIFPLQGKQLIESSVSTGNTTRSSTEEGQRTDSSSLQRGVEDTVKANLQRLIQPTSSIPNIGRKALRQESLELKSQSLQNMRNRVFKSTQAHLMSPFMMPQGDEDLGSRLDSREELSDGEFQLSPHTYKLGPMTDGDRINMEKLNQYYYIYCMPDTPISGEGGGGEQRSLPPSIPSSTTPAHGQKRGGGGGVVWGKAAGGAGPRTSRRTSSERSHVSRPFSDRSSLSMVVSSDTELETSSNPRYKHSSDLPCPPGTERRTLPIIHDSGEGGSGPSPRWRPTCPHHHEEAFVTQRDLFPDGLGSTTERRKRHIVIDMPHIIFNAATPDFAVEAGGKAAAADSYPAPLSERPGVLSKTLKQNEIRHRELQNLLEDVKELNKRTETLSTQAQVSELDPSSNMLC